MLLCNRAQVFILLGTSSLLISPSHLPLSSLPFPISSPSPSFPFLLLSSPFLSPLSPLTSLLFPVRIFFELLSFPFLTCGVQVQTLSHRQRERSIMILPKSMLRWLKHSLLHGPGLIIALEGFWYLLGLKVNQILPLFFFNSNNETTMNKQLSPSMLP